MAVRRRAIEYRSEHVWGDLPLVHVSAGRPMAVIGWAAPAGSSPWGHCHGASCRRWHRHRAVERRRDRDRAGGGWGRDHRLFAPGAVAIGPTAVGPVTAGLLVAPRPPGGIALSGDLGPRMGARVAANRLWRWRHAVAEVPGR
jgi:hypothetical protein